MFCSLQCGPSCMCKICNALLCHLVLWPAAFVNSAAGVQGIFSGFTTVFCGIPASWIQHLVDFIEMTVEHDNCFLTHTWLPGTFSYAYTSSPHKLCLSLMNAVSSEWSFLYFLLNARWTLTKDFVEWKSKTQNVCTCPLAVFSIHWSWSTVSRVL
jgi:hypothetical protein